MGTIVYNFDKVTNLAGFVSAAIPSTDPQQWTVSENYLPDDEGIYIIHNTATQNFYVGIGMDLNHRFSSRQEAVVHLGLSGSDMQQVVVHTGTVAGINNADVQIAPTLGPNNYSVLLDGVSINLEKALIQAFLDVGLPGYKFNTNTKLAGTRFYNNSASDLLLHVNSVSYPDDFTTNGTYYGPLIYTRDSPSFNSVYWQARSKAHSVGFDRVTG